MNNLIFRIILNFPTCVLLFLTACSATPESTNTQNIGNAGELELLSPVDGSTDVSVNTSVITIMVVGIDSSTIDGSNVDISPTLTGSVVQISNSEIQFQPSTRLVEFTTYSINISGLTDQSGNPVDSVNWRFTTGSDLVVNNDCSFNDVLCVDDTAGSNQEYSTIQSAVDASQAGDTVLVFGGNYDGFRVAKSGTSSQRITVVAASSTVFITGSESQGNNAIRLQNASYVTVEGFTINRAGFSISSSYDNACIAARGANVSLPMDSLHIINNYLIDCNPAGMYLSNVNNLFISRNIIESTNRGSSGVQGIGLYLANSEANNAIIVDNKIVNNAGHAIHFNGDSRVGGDGIQRGHIIERNALIGNGENGFNMDGVQNAQIKNNIFANNGRHAIRGFQIDGGQGPADFVIVNNTFYSNSSSPTKFSEDSGGHIIFNNIVIDNGANVFDVSGSNYSGSNNLISTDETTTFVDAANNDFRLKSGSTAIDGGVSSFSTIDAPDIDIAKIQRNGLPDLGAFELGSDNPVWY